MTFSTTRSTILTIGSGRTVPQRRQLARSLHWTSSQLRQTNLFPFLAHDVTSQVESVPAQSKRLSCTSVSVAVGQSAAFFRFFEGRVGSIRWIPNGVGAGS